MPIILRGGIQEVVDTYRVLAIVIKMNKDTAFYEVEVYSRGVKMIVGRDFLFCLALAKALNGIIKLIDNRSISRFTEPNEVETKRLLRAIKALGEEKIEIYVPSSLVGIAKSHIEID